MRKIILIVSLLLLLISMYVVLEPKVSSLVFAQSREHRWNSYITEVQQSQVFDSKKFWEFREFYSPGHFIFEENGLDRKSVLETAAHIHVPKEFLTNTYPFLLFTSKHVTSIDSLLEAKQAAKVKKKFSTIPGTLLARGDNFVITKEEDTVTLIFITSEQEMKKTNGFHEYIDNKDLMKGKYWLSISNIVLK